MKLSIEDKKEIIKELKSEICNSKKVYVEVINDDVILPAYANVGDAGMDIRSSEEIVIRPDETKIIHTGLKIAVPEGYELQIRPRSGVSLKTPLRISNSPGTIDSGYRDEIGIIVTNTSNKNEKQVYTLEEKNNKPGTYIIKKNDRIAQIVLCKYETIEFEKLDKNSISKIGSNRGGGFGHTGEK